MSLSAPGKDHDGTPGPWFTYAVVAIAVTAAIGSFGMIWVSRADHQARTAFLPLNRDAVTADRRINIDSQTTGSVPGRSSPPTEPCGSSLSKSRFCGE